jgi:hypothetical protein
MPAPYEIISAPIVAWLAPLGSAFPDLADLPLSPWVKLGTSGDLNYMDDGVTVDHSETNKIFRALGDGGPRKVFPDEQNLVFSLVLADAKLEQIKLAFNGNTVTTVAPGAGTAGYKKIGLTRTVPKTHYALLLRTTGISPEGDGWNMQYEIPIVTHTGSPKPVYRRSDPVGYAIELTALVDFSATDPTERFGRLLVQSADAGT